MKEDYVSVINNPRSDPQERLAALSALERDAPLNGGKTGEVNNHIHTIYSFSPYTPSMAALRAREAGLEAAGSVDHDSIAAAEEMIAACSVLGMGGCAGFEVRVSFKTGADGRPGAFADRKINNPDSAGLAYMTVQGAPTPSLPLIRSFLDPVRHERRLRTRRMAEAANTLLAEAGLEQIAFEEDILDRSQFDRGGEITERHLLAAVADKLILKYERGPALIEGLKAGLGLQVSSHIGAALSDPANPHYLFDLLGVLKSGFLSRIFIQPGERECIPANRVTDFAASVGAIPAYAYLGDVGESPTGDKKAEKFEDDYLEELFDQLARLGYRAVTYMPPRNTAAQLRRVRRLCGEWGFMEISGVDINSSRQSFNCPEVLRDEFRHLVDTTWALIAHERLTSLDPALSLFSPENPLAARPLKERLNAYAAVGKGLDLRRPEESAPEAAKKLQEGGYLL
ncbi:MAG: PHP domain-containing protein [Spirochaetaceae bacterium]|jgi:hypothetical protein|nr:PHP domain-containing protein [Spirochaetaceae bacterium]